MILYLQVPIIRCELRRLGELGCEGVDKMRYKAGGSVVRLKKME